MSYSSRLQKSFVILSSILFATLCFAQEQVPEPVGELTLYIGDIRVREAGQEVWVLPELNQPVHNGDAIRAGAESRAEVVLADNGVIRIGEQSIFEFEDMAHEDGELSGGGLLFFGRIWSRLRNLGDSGVQVRSPNAVMAVRGTTWRADAYTDSSLSVWVYEGRVDVNRREEQQQEASEDSIRIVPGQPAPPTRVPVQGPRPVPGPYQVTLQEWVQITEGMRLNVLPDGRYATSLINQSVDSSDDWVQWNQYRDEETDE